MAKGPMDVHKIVVIQVVTKEPTTPIPPLDFKHKLFVVHTMDEFTKAYGTLNDGDVFIFRGHANKDHFPIAGTGHKAGAIAWTALAKEMTKRGLKHVPQPGLVFFAACMASSEKPPNGKKGWIHQPLRHHELNRLRAAFNTQAAIAPFYEYATHSGWLPSGKDEFLTKEPLENMIMFQLGRISAGTLLARLRKGKFMERFDFSFGCNGWNHSAGCCCGWGGRKK